MTTFFLNTATDETFIALFDEEKLVQESRWMAENRESETLLPAVSELLEAEGLKPEQIDRLVVCTGPGGFTSVRIGVSAANAWAQSMNIPIAAVSVFDIYPKDVMRVIAANAKEAWVKMPDEEPVFVRVDNFDSENFAPLAENFDSRLRGNHHARLRGLNLDAKLSGKDLDANLSGKDLDANLSGKDLDAGIQEMAGIRFTGVVNDEWMKFLKSKGAAYIEAREQVPPLNELDFQHEIVQAWYYKSPNITWSSKNSKII